MSRTRMNHPSLCRFRSLGERYTRDCLCMRSRRRSRPTGTCRCRFGSQPGFPCNRSYAVRRPSFVRMHTAPAPGSCSPAYTGPTCSRFDRLLAIGVVRSCRSRWGAIPPSLCPLGRGSCSSRAGPTGNRSRTSRCSPRSESESDRKCRVLCTSSECTCSTCNRFRRCERSQACSSYP